jgi:MYXO-CTERM domain-containing protein
VTPRGGARTAAPARVALVLAIGLAGSPAAAQKIVIDPGHGGTDPGGVGSGLLEKDIVLDVARRFAALLEADTADPRGGGVWSVHLTRADDTFVSLAARTSYANSIGADRFMSIHSNAFSDPAANGTETFSYAASGQGAALRNLVQEEMIAAWRLRDRGNKTANFHVLRETAMPAELHELAFITNATDAAKLASPAERAKAAEAHLFAIQRHYGLARYLPGEPEPPPPDAGVADDEAPDGGADPDDDAATDPIDGVGGCGCAAGAPGGAAGTLLLGIAVGALARRRRHRR